MKITILGSGGFVTIPRPCCQCRICAEARKKGTPYSRNGPSIYIKEINAIFDTPKDIINSINREGITKIENIFFTHWHPDHTEGMRIVEEITTEWSKESPFKLKNHGKPINVFAPKKVMNEIRNINSPVGSYLEYFESQNFIKTEILELNKEKTFNNIDITPIKNKSDKKVTSVSYLIKENNKKVVYMPCDVKPIENHDFLENCDLFIVGSPFLESENGIKNIPDDHPLREELFSMQEIIDLIKKYKIKKTVIVHIEEMWGLSYDDYKKSEKKYQQYNLVFSYDGLKIEV